uniref:Ral guanine nucleotide dissociation stimulator-like 1 n=1 Tax=Phallusia mammillata TaxID=59560 RepID=A0A6F9DRC4_9ASCI|nr:ral guanine nucleotide dissociation stimulator-like 1 [Phallusia mammillata]
MLIELDTISGSGGGRLDFADQTPPMTPLGLSRPDYLPLTKRHTFYPTLPPTPEIIGRERSYCSLPSRRASNSNAYDVKDPCVKTSDISDARMTRGDAKRSICCSWLVSRWLKVLGKSPPKHRDVIASNDTVKPENKSDLPVATVTRRRAATVQPHSLFGKENKREWGEERHNDVIYNVMLKRVRRAPSPSSLVSDGLLWETHKVRIIKGATVGYLVSQLCKSFLEDWEEKNFFTVFFATYRWFAKPADVLEQIKLECDKLKEDTDETRSLLLCSIRRVMRTWIERYFDEDFYDPPHFPLLHRLLQLAQEVFDDNGHDATCDFIDYVKAKLKSAEVKNLQESAIENLNSPSRFSDLHMETEDIQVDSEAALNHDASKTLLGSAFSTLQVAEQLTVKDANLFLRVVPHHCLKAVRSSKIKPACVRATIDQFNKVVYSVLATCLCTSLKTSQRVKIICKWIEIAQQCRELKNFSSLRAVVSGLQTHVIHRMRKTWQQVPHSYIELLRELEEINMKDIIMKVGTAKVNTETSSISKVRKDATFRRNRAIHSGIMHGTVPYLGSFLTDLTYLHTAKPDYVEKGLVNFNKCRKEFEQLAQLQLWQASCKGYQHLEPDGKFNEWFNSITPPSDEQAHKLSEQIEPPVVGPTSPSQPATPMKRTISEMFALHTAIVEPSANGHVLSNHVRNSSDDTSSLNSNKSNGHVPTLDSQSDEERLINVEVIRKQQESKDGPNPTNWDTIKLSSNDRTAAVIRKALSVFEVDEQLASTFTLVQLLPDDKELHIPDSSNVFYAMNSSLKEYHFALVEEGVEIQSSMRPVSLQSSPKAGHTPKTKKHHRKTLSTSAVGQSGPSPMRNFYRHLAMGSMSIASSGSYSPARENQKCELESTEPTNPSPETSARDSNRRSSNSRRDALTTMDDSVISFALRSVDASDEECDDSWTQRMWKKMHKGHRRQHSDFASHEVIEQVMMEADGIRPRTSRMVHERPSKSIVLPVQIDEPKEARSESTSTYSRESTSDDSFGRVDDDAIYANGRLVTWPRNRVASASSASNTWSRRTAVRKHHSDHRPTSGFYRQMSEIEVLEDSTKRDAELATSSRKSKHAMKRSESRSKFYVTVEGDEGSGSLSKQSSSSSMEPIREVGSPPVSPVKSPYHRSSSDPCILEYSSSVDEVFKSPPKTRRENTNPQILVECPSPRKVAFNSGWDDVTINDYVTADVGEDQLDLPKPRSRSSTAESETTHL